MGRSFFLTILLISAILSLSFSQGFGRRIKIIRHYGRWHSPEPSLHEENSGVEREMVEMEIMDYKDPEANTNPRSGEIFYPPPSPPPAPPQMH